jgi:SAM-dependent methyltransferase
VYVSEALREQGVLRSPFRGVGFGVGAEPLPTTFASFGCHITATDLPPDEATKKGWAGGVQYAGKIEGLRNDQICPEDQFRRLVDFRYCDMNNISSDLREFDFCWSCCALEHLGSLSAGMRFIERSLDTLRPGGWAVHTTEFNIFSDVATIESGATVLYRQRDLKWLVEHLQRQGHQIASLDLAPGDQVLDRFVDVPPYEQCEPHLALDIMGFASTSVAIIVQKRH